MAKRRNPRILRTISVLISVCFLCVVPSAFAGSIVGWGSHVVDSSDPRRCLAIAAGENHSLALKSDGSIIGLGSDDDGEATPPDGSDFIAIAGGVHHSLAIKESCEYVLAGDLNDDCRVDSADSAIMAASWLIDCHREPTDPTCLSK